MRFTPIPLKGAFLIDLEKIGDDRGFFARFFCKEEFEKHGLEPEMLQANCSFSREKGTLRGLHYQLPPYEETKLVRCLSGALYDVILDIRPDSPTFGHSFGAALTAVNRQMMYVPRGFAHGFITLEPDTEILYLVSAPYSKENERGIRWNDPKFNIAWPETPVVISDRDKSHPDFNPQYHLARLSYTLSSEGAQDVASGSLSNVQEHCQTDKARAFESEDGVTNCPDSQRECKKGGLKEKVAL